MKRLYSKRCLGIILSSIVLAGTVLGHFAYDSFKVSADSKVYERLQAVRNETEGATNKESSSNSNEVVRAIVTLKDDSVAEISEISEYSSKLKSQENKIIDNQSKIIEKVENLTDNKVVSQTGYLVNSFSIDATRKQLKKIAKMDGVENVYEAATYKPCMETALEQGNVKAQIESKDYGYTGEGTVIAIIDTGLNYNHKDMVLDDSVKTKFSKEEWQQKIDLLGHGKYFSDKVPFGYNYVTGKEDCLSDSDKHGYHVTGIAAGNGEEVCGVAKNAQVIGMQVFGEANMVTSDGIVRAIEDAVKLGADVINMSLGSTAGFVTDEDYVQNAVDMASKEGVICCISAGNDGNISDAYGKTNILGVKDTALISSPGTALSALTVGSADNKRYSSGHRAENVNMSSFSSWGPTNELNIKPEITAPGGNINAAFDGVDEYEYKSGTSMAAPFVAGAQAIMKNAIKERGMELKGSELTAFMKNSLINTADVLYDSQKFVPFSVRRQGAGQIDLLGAVNNHVLVTCNGEAKVELGDFEQSKTFELVLTNYSDKAANYTLEKSQLYKDYTGSKEEDNEYGIKIAKDSYITFNMSQVTVPPKGQVTVEASVNITDEIERDSFIEGFVNFKGDNVENIGVPVLGFYGDWSREAIIDKPIYEEGDSVLSRLKTIRKFDYGTALTGVNNNEILGTKWEKVLDKDNTDEILLENLVYYDQQILTKIDSIKPLDENIELDVMTEEFDASRAKINVKEDGYYTLDINLEQDASINLVEYYDDKAGTKGKRILISDKTFGHYAKEFKFSKDATYVISLELEKKLAPNTKMASIKYTASSGENCYVLKKLYSSEAVAFSPNEDTVRDIVKPMVLQVRNAKEIKVKVLNKDSKVIRNIATLTDVSKIRYGDTVLFPGNKYFSKPLTNPSNCEDINWDGKIYNKQSGEYEYVEDGQYYIQLESKVAKDEDVQVVTMPVKVDRVKPTIEKLEFKDNGGKPFVEFLVKDDYILNDNYYVDIQYTKGAANKIQYCTFNNKLVETVKNTEGNYVFDLGQFSNCNIKKISVMFEDMAGNQTIKKEKLNENKEELDQAEIDERIKSVGFFKLCDDVAIQRNLKDGMKVEMEDNVLYIEGDCREDISVFCNGKEAMYAESALDIYEDGKRFQIEIEALKGASWVSMNLVIKKKDVEIFSQTYNINILQMKPCDIKLVNNESIKASKYFEEEKTEVLYMEKDGQGKVSFEVEVDSKDESFDKHNIDMTTLLDCFGYEDGVGPLTLDVNYQGNNKYKITVDDIKDGGNISINCMYDTYFEGNLNVYVTTNESKYSEVKDGYEVKLVSGISDLMCIKEDMLNSDGTLTVKGKLGALPSIFTINKNPVNVDDSTCEFAYNLPIKKGLNFINIKAVINGKEVSIDKCLHYEKVNIVWHDSIKEDNKVINTDKNVFNLAGTVYSYSNVISMIVCGEMVYSATDSVKTYEDKPFVKQFDYNIELVKGTNKIKIEIITSASEVVEKEFTVVYK